MARKRINATKMEIIRVASKMFLEKGYSKTTAKSICDVLEISTGNLTFYYPTKEHMLAVFVRMLCDYQWKMMEKEKTEGNGSVMAVCMELTEMIIMCHEDEIVREFFLAAYTSPMTLEIIRENDAGRAKEVFGEFNPEWTDQQFVEAEILVSGIEYASLIPMEEPISLELRIAGAVDAVLKVFNVPEELRQKKIRRMQELDCRKIGKRALKELKKYIEDIENYIIIEEFRS